ncbi:MAG TPA: UTRA domain-containing protein [Steroidobacteraceae bacterium]|nr:UTRA domain-containing protein [Steroidobacteraceae bacterium]
MKPKQKPAALAPYEKVKRHILGRIRNGEWTAGMQLPSEPELVQSLGVARMTVHRALQELSAEGLLSRIQGVGTFLLPPPKRTEVFKVQEIDDEIEARGRVARPKVIVLEAVPLTLDLSSAFELRPGSEIFHSVVVHHEDNTPVQLEERYVNPQFAPRYLEQDFHQGSTGKYLLSLGHPDEIDHVIYAIAPDKRTQKLLRIDEHEPCLLLSRRAWGANNTPHSLSRFTYPGSRYSLGSRYRVTEEKDRRIFRATSQR